MLLERITPEFMSLSLFLVLLNIPLFIFGYKRLGTAFTVYAIYSVIVYSLSAWVINDIPFPPPLQGRIYSYAPFSAELSRGSEAVLP